MDLRATPLRRRAPGDDLDRDPVAAKNREPCVGMALELLGKSFGPIPDRVEDPTEPLTPRGVRRVIELPSPIQRRTRDRPLFRTLPKIIAREITYPALPMSVREGPIDFYAMDATNLGFIVERDLSKSVASGAANTT